MKSCTVVTWARYLITQCPQLIYAKVCGIFQGLFKPRCFLPHRHEIRSSKALPRRSWALALPWVARWMGRNLVPCSRLGGREDGDLGGLERMVSSSGQDVSLELLMKLRFFTFFGAWILHTCWFPTAVIAGVFCLFPGGYMMFGHHCQAIDDDEWELPSEWAGRMRAVMMARQWGDVGRKESALGEIMWLELRSCREYETYQKKGTLYKYILRIHTAVYWFCLWYVYREPICICTLAIENGKMAHVCWWMLRVLPLNITVSSRKRLFKIKSS